MGDMNKNALKIGAAVVLLFAAGGLLYFTMHSESVQPDRLTYVCVSTGKLFMMPRGGPPKVFPVENPETHQRTLLPCAKMEDGYYVSSLMRATLKEMGDVNKVVDAGTLRVTVANP